MTLGIYSNPAMATAPGGGYGWIGGKALSLLKALEVPLRIKKWASRATLILKPWRPVHMTET
jgi:hypothetical protein